MNVKLQIISIRTYIYKRYRKINVRNFVEIYPAVNDPRMTRDITANIKELYNNDCKQEFNKNPVTLAPSNSLTLSTSSNINVSSSIKSSKMDIFIQNGQSICFNSPIAPWSCLANNKSHKRKPQTQGFDSISGLV